MGATREQVQSFYDAMVKGDFDTARKVGGAISPDIAAGVDEDPTGVVQVAAGILGDPHRPARQITPPQAAAAAPGTAPIIDARGIMQQAGAYGQAMPPQGEAGMQTSPETLQTMGKVALPVVAAIAAERLGARGLQPVLKALATNPKTRLLLSRAVQGIAGAAGFGAPEAIEQGSLDPYKTPGTALNAMLPMAGTVGRRLLPESVSLLGRTIGKGGAVREAVSQSRELTKFGSVADPAVAAMTPQRVVAESGQTAASFKPTLTPAMRKELVAMGVPAKALQRLNPKKAAALVEELQAMKQQIGMGERSALMPPPSAVPPAPVAAPPLAAAAGPAPVVGAAPLSPQDADALLARAQDAADAAKTQLPQPSALGGSPGAVVPPVATPAAAPAPIPAGGGLGGAGGGGAPPAAAVVPPAAPAAPGAALTPETLQPEQVADLVADPVGAALANHDMLTGTGPPQAAAAAGGGIPLPPGIGQGGGDAGLLARFMPHANTLTGTPPTRAARRIGRRSKVR